MKNKIKTLIFRTTLVTLAIYGSYAFAYSAGPLSGFGPWVTATDIMAMLIGLLAPIAAIVGLIMTIIPRARTTGVNILLPAATCALLFLPAMHLAQEMRLLGFYMISKRMEPAIVAIAKYQKDKDVAPASLEALVPDYLPEVPSRIPPFEITIDSPDRWTIWADVSTGLLASDTFLYRSDRNYNDLEGMVKRVGKSSWVYMRR